MQELLSVLVLSIPLVLLIVIILLCETFIKNREIIKGKHAEENGKHAEETKETSQYDWLQNRFNRTN